MRFDGRVLVALALTGCPPGAASSGADRGAPARVRAPDAPPATAPVPPADATEPPSSGVPARSARATESPPPSLEHELARARALGYTSGAAVVEERVRQERRKMKLTPEEGARAAGYIAEELPAMPRARELSVVMPKTAVELVRSVRERDVARAEAESMAEYLVALRAALRLGNPEPFDENCSHVVGREWHEIDYRGEGMTWENQRRIYARHGVTSFRDRDNLERFFRVESTAPYFRKLYRPEGTVP
ncbi:MAG TPA: hypothetical protein VFZ53_09155 [Polyangiaceae bacterium]